MRGERIFKLSAIIWFYLHLNRCCLDPGRLSNDLVRLREILVRPEGELYRVLLLCLKRLSGLGPLVSLRRYCSTPPNSFPCRRPSRAPIPMLKLSFYLLNLPRKMFYTISFSAFLLFPLNATRRIFFNFLIRYCFYYSIFKLLVHFYSFICWLCIDRTT